MTTTTTRVQEVPALSRGEAMALAGAEYDRFLDLLRTLRPDEWRRPTECAAWDVRAMASHLLAEAESHFSLREMAHQMRAYRKAKSGPMIDAMTALQVRDRANLTPDEIVARFERAVPRSVQARRRMPRLMRRMRMKVDPPFEKERWPLSYLMDVIYTRDTWMHRGDISRATGRDIVLTPEHDGRIVADMVAEWARRHGRPFALTLTGPAGGSYVAGGGGGGENIELDTVEFCRIVSGRAQGTGLLATAVPF
jgi:uncharacterized protein (TIGR03083 family)